MTDLMHAPLSYAMAGALSSVSIMAPEYSHHMHVEVVQDRALTDSPRGTLSGA